MRSSSSSSVLSLLLLTILSTSFAFLAPVEPTRKFGAAGLHSTLHTSSSCIPVRNRVDPSNRHYRYYSSQLQKKKKKKKQTKNYKIYCDLDGVLCDFDKAVQFLSQGIPANDLDSKTLWGLVDKADRFYETLAWTRDGKKLWESISSIPGNPTILTGVSSPKICSNEKALWCQRELGLPTNHVNMASHLSKHKRVNRQRKRAGVVNVITCWSNNKHYESEDGAVLIDDRIALAKAWRDKGGIFVHHTSTDNTLRQLRELGILEDSIARKCSNMTLTA